MMGGSAGLREGCMHQVHMLADAMSQSACVQAIERETNPTTQRSIVTLVSHRQKRAAELLPNIMLAKRLLGEVRGVSESASVSNLGFS